MNDFMLDDTYVFDIPNNGEGEIEILSGEDILNVYWEFWHNKMLKKFGKNSEFINAENCIEDYFICNYGYKIEEKQLKSQNKVLRLNFIRTIIIIGTQRHNTLLTMKLDIN